MDIREVYAVSNEQMPEWKMICAVFADKIGAKLLFVNAVSCGVELSDGSFKHIYIQEMADLLKEEVCNECKYMEENCEDVVTKEG